MRFWLSWNAVKLPYIQNLRKIHLPTDQSVPNTMSITSIPRFLLPRGQSLLFTHPGSWPKAARPMASQCRYASATSKPPKTRILEKPTKYNPPSHSSRTSKRRIPRQYPGPPLSAEQEEAQQKKQYPNMFPPEGTFMFWLLTNRMIHMWICLVSTILSHNRSENSTS